MVRANHLYAQSLGHVGEDAVDLLRLATSQPRDLGSVAHDAGDAFLGVFQNPVRAGEDRIQAPLQLQSDSRKCRYGRAKLHEHSKQNRHLNYDRGSSYGDK
jgi:Flp pilus assembly protein TadD